MRLGLCIRGFFKGDLFDVDLPGRGCWTHCSVEHISGFKEEDFDFDEDIYGLDLTISFIRKVRDERRFDSLDDLRAQLERDREFCFQ